MDEKADKSLAEKIDFDYSDELAIVEEYAKKKEILTSKLTNNVTKTSNKQHWQQIADLLNARHPFKKPKSCKQVQTKWKNMVSKVLKIP
jgi:hypothetical protein